MTDSASLPPLTNHLALVAVAITAAVVFLVVVATRLFGSWKEWKRSLPPSPPPCAHEWDVRVKIVAHPVRTSITPGSYVELYQIRSVERLNTGSTSVLLTCRKCGTVEERTFNGAPHDDDVEGD